MFGMLMIAVLQAAQNPAAADLSQPPRLRPSQAIITFQDYPKEALRRKEYGIVSIVLHVSADGRVTSCDVTERSGSTTLDIATCSLFKARARFEPAKNASGSPVAGEYRTASSWGVDEHQPRPAIDLSLQVATLPQDYGTPVKALLNFDETGHVTLCKVTETSGSAAADRAACAYIEQQLVIAAPKSRSTDVPPVAVRYLTAKLSTQPVTPPARK